MSLLKNAEALAEALNDVAVWDCTAADVLDALATLGLTLANDTRGAVEKAYAHLLTDVDESADEAA